MAHAEICPVCGGKGRTETTETETSTLVRKSQTCHGCNGKGWVEVGSDDPVAIPVIPWQPIPYKPEWPPVTWIYAYDRGL